MNWYLLWASIFTAVGLVSYFVAANPIIVLCCVIMALSVLELESRNKYRKKANKQ